MIIYILLVVLSFIILFRNIFLNKKIKNILYPYTLSYRNYRNGILEHEFDMPYMSYTDIMHYIMLDYDNIVKYNTERYNIDNPYLIYALLMDKKELRVHKESGEDLYKTMSLNIQKDFRFKLPSWYILRRFQKRNEKCKTGA